MSINLNDNIKINAGKPSESKYLNGVVNYTSVSEANSLVPKAERHLGLTVLLDGVEYWWKSGVEDVDLITKTSESDGSFSDFKVITTADTLGSLGYISLDDGSPFAYVVGVSDYGSPSVYYGLSAGTFNLYDNGGNTGIGTFVLSGLREGSSNISGSSLSGGFGHTAIGQNALSNIEGGIYDTAVGFNAMGNSSRTNFQGGNVAVGKDAGSNMGDVSNNVAIGISTLQNISAGTQDGDFNVALGWRALRETKNGEQNLAIGSSAMRYSNNVGGNIAIGTLALLNYSGSGIDNVFDGNVAVGQSAGENLSGFDNILFGQQSGFNAGGDHNIFLGRNSGRDITSPDSTILIGPYTDSSKSDIHNAVGIGSGVTVAQDDTVVFRPNASIGLGTNTPEAQLHVTGSILSNQSISAETIFSGDTDVSELFALKNSFSQFEIVSASTQVGDPGHILLDGVPTAYFMEGTFTEASTYFGYSAGSFGDSNFGGNVGFGTEALGNSSSSNSYANTAIGSFSMGDYDGTNYHNTAIGFESLKSISAGTHDAGYNTALGSRTFRDSTNAFASLAIGYEALRDSVESSGNIAIGYHALRGATFTPYGPGSVQAVFAIGLNSGRDSFGSKNLFIGSETGRDNSGVDNVLIGHQAGHAIEAGLGEFLTGSSMVTMVGSESYSDKSDVTNAVALGYRSRLAQDNTFIVANGLDVGIGTSTPEAMLHVTGNVLSDQSISAETIFSGDTDVSDLFLSSNAILPSAEYLIVSYVDTIDGSDANGSVGTSKAFQTIISATSQSNEYITNSGIEGAKALVVVRRGTYYENSINREHVDMYFDRGSVVISSVAGRPVFCDFLNDSGGNKHPLNITVTGKGSFYHTNFRPFNDSQAIATNNANTKEFNFEAYEIDGFQNFGNNQQTFNYSDLRIRFFIDFHNNKNINMVNCTFLMGLSTGHYLGDNVSVSCDKCEMILPSDGYDSLLDIQDYSGGTVDTITMDGLFAPVNTSAMTRIDIRDYVPAAIITEPQIAAIHHVTDNTVGGSFYNFRLSITNSVARIRKERCMGVNVTQNIDVDNSVSERGYVIIKDLHIEDETVGRDTTGIVTGKKSTVTDNLQLGLNYYFTNTSVETDVVQAVGPEGTDTGISYIDLTKAYRPLTVGGEGTELTKLYGGTSYTASTPGVVSISAGTAFALSLPSTPSVGDKFTIKDSSGSASTYNITINVDGGSYLIDGSSSETLTENYESSTYIFDGDIYINI